MTDDEKELLTIPEVAALLRKSPVAVRHMIDRAQIPGVVRIGKSIRVRAKDLRKQLGLI